MADATHLDLDATDSVGEDRQTAIRMLRLGPYDVGY